MSVVVAVALLAASSQAAPSVYPPDRSLTAAAYVSLGMPAPDRAWSPADYLAAVEALRKLRGEDPARLPRYKSPQSGAVFARLVAEDNLGVLAAPDTPVSGRLGIASDFMGAGKQIVLLYLEPSTDNVIFDNELVEASGFMLRLWEQFGKLLSDPKAQTPPDKLVRLGGIVAAYLSSVLDSIAESDTYRGPARARMASHLGGAVGSLWALLSPLQRADFRAHLDRVASSEPDPQTRLALATLKAGIRDGE